MNNLGNLRRQLYNFVWSTCRSLGGRRPNVLFITCQNRISASQIFPFYFFRRSLQHLFAFDFREISVADYQRSSNPPAAPAELVFFQPWWDIDPKQLNILLARIKTENPDAKIIFLDCYAPLDLRLAQFVNDDIDFYVKKQVFRDRLLYGNPTMGDTNLVDYYGCLYQLKYPETVFSIPSGFIEKLVVGPGFATADFMLPYFMKSDIPTISKRPIDLHARLGGGGEGWYGRMREHSRENVKAISGIKVAAEGAVDHSQYMRELRSSKICFSPFGFGEVCWRDYEAVMCGALLLKPDMGHLETDPDIFRPYETYVPVRWDFKDLEEKVRYYLSNNLERESIALNAYKVLSDYFQQGGFQAFVEKLGDFNQGKII